MYYVLGSSSLFFITDANGCFYYVFNDFNQAKNFCDSLNAHTNNFYQTLMKNDYYLKSLFYSTQINNVYQNVGLVNSNFSNQSYYDINNSLSFNNNHSTNSSYSPRNDFFGSQLASHNQGSATFLANQDYMNKNNQPFPNSIKQNYNTVANDYSNKTNSFLSENKDNSFINPLESIFVKNKHVVKSKNEDYLSSTIETANNILENSKIDVVDFDDVSSADFDTLTVDNFDNVSNENEETTLNETTNNNTNLSNEANDSNFNEETNDNNKEVEVVENKVERNEDDDSQESEYDFSNWNYKTIKFDEFINKIN